MNQTVTTLATGTDARLAALAAAEHLARAVELLNATGLPRLDTQRPGCAYGAAYDALRITIAELWPTLDHDRILDPFHDGLSIVTGARLAAEDADAEAADAAEDARAELAAHEAASWPDGDEAGENRWHLLDSRRRDAEHARRQAAAVVEVTHADCCAPTGGTGTGPRWSWSARD